MSKEKKLKKKKIRLAIEATPGAQIMVAGSFNEWAVLDVKKAKMMKEGKGGLYTLNMFLPLGEHEYKFYNQGEWFNDPTAENHKRNIFGTLNSVITVA